MTMPNRPDDEPLKRTAPKPRQTRPRRLSDQGPAQTVQTSLSPSQAAWVASRGVPAAAYLRGLVERDQAEASGRRLAFDRDGSPVIGMTHRILPGNRVSVLGEFATVREVSQNFAVVVYDGCAPSGVVEALPDLVKIGGDV
jgi:hypothetical protein